MADSSGSGSKTEKATPKKRRDQRKEGNVYVLSYKTYKNLKLDEEEYKVTYFEKYVVLE